MKKQKYKNQEGIEKYLKGKKNIFDIGTGPNGSHWWKEIDKDASITSIDMYNFPEKQQKNIKVYKHDANKLFNIKARTLTKRAYGRYKIKPAVVKWKNSFDLVVANHLLEHVESPKKVVEGIHKLLRKNGTVYGGFPDANNFTDIFYHLIQPNGGGHIQFLTNDSVQKTFEQSGFAIESCRVWPDDWLWFTKLYNWKTYMWPENKYLDQSKIEYIANVFRKELTPEKGYFYGWEMVFKKK